MHAPMEIVDASLWLYGTSLTQPVEVRPGRVVESRESLLLCLRADDGRLGWGEAAPLPGFSREALDEVVAAAARLARSIAETRPAVSANGLLPTDVDALTVGLPSLQFALDSALDGLAGPGDEGGVEVPVARLLQGDATLIPAQAVDYVSRGYSALKLKVGRHSVDDDVLLVHAVADAIDPGIELRLDANRSWSWTQALRFADGVRGIPIAFVEEPLADSQRLAELAGSWRLPIALDESVAEVLSPSMWSVPDYAAAIVVKPTLVGRRLRELVSASRATGFRTVLSGCYETGVGTAAIVRSAMQLAIPVPAVGVGTIAWLEEDCLKPSVDFLTPVIQPDLVSVGAIRPDVDRLRRITHA